VKLTTIRVVMGIVAAENLHLEQLDVKTTFLHGELEEDIYMQQPEGFAIQGKDREPSLQAKEKPIRFEASSKTVVQEV
jgi:hypothetical protein